MANRNVPPTSDYVVGDLLWSRIPGYPYWPCMVTYDPLGGIFKKVKACGRGTATVYHVKYFGENAEHGWTWPNNILDYRGKEQFDNYVAELSKSLEKLPSVARNKELSKFHVSESKLDSWKSAVSEADKIVHISQNVRNDAPMYIHPNSTDEGLKSPAIEESATTADKNEQGKRSQAVHYDQIHNINGKKIKRFRKINNLCGKCTAVEESTTTADENKQRKESQTVNCDQRHNIKGKKTKTYRKVDNLCVKSTAVEESTGKESQESNNQQGKESLAINCNQRHNIKGRKTKRYRKMNNLCCVKSIAVEESTAIADKNDQGKESHAMDCDLMHNINEKTKRCRKLYNPFVKLTSVEQSAATADESEHGKESQAIDCDQRYNIKDKKTKWYKKVDNLWVKSIAVEESTATADENDRGKESHAMDCDSMHNINDEKTKRYRKIYNPFVKLTSVEESAATADENNQGKGSEAVNQSCDINDETSSYREIDNLCVVCEKTEADLLCCGGCMQWFHAVCLQLVSVPKQFKCAECLRGKHSCFSCKSDNGETKKCRKATCGKFYHVACMKKYRVSSREKFVCPLHFCHTCFSENPQMVQSTKSECTRCIRCPIAYHQKEECLGAGSVPLTKSFVVCPEHAGGKEANINISSILWCSRCGKKEGKFLNCVTCPLAFHEECLMVAEYDNRDFRCENCVSQKHFRYGVLVWVKIGGFKWWPAKILFQKEVPESLLQKPHGVGDFPVKTLKTNAFYWVHKGIIREYCENDKRFAFHLAGVAKKTMLGAFGKNYVQCLTESAKIFDKIAEARKSQVKEKGKFIFTKTNRHFGVNKVVGDNLIFECGCDPNSEFPCGYDSMCLNRSMCYECHPSLCSAKEKCCNQKFSKREYPRLTSFETSDRGFGLKTVEDLKKGQFVIEYVGDVIDESELCKRLGEKNDAKDRDYYFLTLDKGRYIDAGPCGNLSRYMNHSCSPNCETQKWCVNGEMRIGLFAVRAIPAGSELTFDYNWDSLNYEHLKCLCGSENCCGTIGGKLHNEIDTNFANHETMVKSSDDAMYGATKVKVGNSEDTKISAKHVKLKNCESSLNSQHLKQKNCESSAKTKSLEQINNEEFTTESVNRKNSESLTIEIVKRKNSESLTIESVKRKKKSYNLPTLRYEDIDYQNRPLCLNGTKIPMTIIFGSSKVIHNYGMLWL